MKIIYLFGIYYPSYICTLNRFKMTNEKTIKDLELLRDDFYRKYKSLNETIGVLKGTSTKDYAEEQTPALEMDGYDVKWSMKNKLSYILKKEGKFLHIRQIAKYLHQFEPKTSEKDFITKLYPAIAFLKKNSLAKFSADSTNVNTFWGSKNCVETPLLSGFYETAVGSKAVPGFLLLGVLFLLLLE